MDAVRSRAGAVTSILAMLCLALAVNASAQSGSATITGTVYDNVGVVPGASVTVTSAGSGTVRTATTTEVGFFRFQSVPPGRYTVKVEVQGFKPLTVQEFELLGSDARDLGRLVLQAGGVQESVSVIAQVTPVQVSESSRKQGITSDQISNITMKGRDLYGFLATLPGVIDANISRDSTSWTSANNITINGAPVTSSNIMIDGIAQRDEYGTNAFVNPNIDAVGEIQVVANGFTAENGRNTGGLVNFVTRSGTTSFKGSGWYNARRDSWNKNDYIRLRTNQAKPLYRVNVGGFSIGGPVIIPGVLDSRTSGRKVFFFVSQEYSKDARPAQVTTANYPTDRERMGDFSDTRLTTAGSSYGNVQQILDYQNVVNGVLQPFPGNIIPANRINPVGQKLLNYFLKPNGYVPQVSGQQYNANFIANETPLHDRTDHVYRGDVVLTRNLRFSGKLLADREDNIQINAFGPGFGRDNNFVPGWLVGGTVTYVINPTTVNEINGGYTLNHYAFRAYPEGDDYTKYYCFNVGVCPPRIVPYGQNPEYWDQAPPKNYALTNQLQQYPYLPVVQTSGGNRAALASYDPGHAGGRVMPTKNTNWRYVFQDDLSKTVGRHALKFGAYSEIDATFAPISAINYTGVYNFGSNSSNPRDSGNGYANMLLGVITQYSENSDRVAWDTRHWENDVYAQDSWRVNSRVTLDYGVRITHSGAYWEANRSTSAFYPELYDRSKAVRLYFPVCTTNVAGDQACATANQRSIDPANPTVQLASSLAGQVVQGSGDVLNGIRRGGRGEGWESNPNGTYDPAKDSGDYYDFPYLRAAPRFGMAWDVNGDGRSALRASTGIFFDFPRGGLGQFIGQPPVSYNRVVTNLTIDELAAYSTGGSNLTFTQNPVGGPVATLEGKDYELPVSYNLNFAYQRDIGFSTVVEAAYVGNWGKNGQRTLQTEVLPYSFYADPAHQFNQTTLSANYFKPTYPGMATINDFTNGLTTLSYNSAQFSVQRRLSHGLQMGLAYTISKGMSDTGYDEYTADPNLTIPNVGGVRAGGEDALHARYWGPTGVDRRHNLTFNYSYQIPSPVKSGVLKVILSDWQLSGVTKWLTGTSVNPSCGTASSVRGVQYTNPSLTPTITSRCDLTGEPINAGVRVDPDPANPDILTATWFNPGAFKLATAVNGQGNFGNAPLGLLRNPSYSNWDMTLARRIPIRVGRNGGVRVQFQVYNVFNQVRFTGLNSSLSFAGATATTQNTSTVAQYSQNAGVIPPRQIGLTLRMDF